MTEQETGLWTMTMRDIQAAKERRLAEMMVVSVFDATIEGSDALKDLTSPSMVLLLTPPNMTKGED
jgi:hypothetical protein